MAAARLLRGTRRYFTLRHLILFAVLAMTLFIVYTTFSRGNEYLMARSVCVGTSGSLVGTFSSERFQRSTGDQRGKVPNVLRF